MKIPLVFGSIVDAFQNRTVTAPIEVYLDILGPTFYAIFFGVIGGIIYSSTKSGIIAGAYFIIIGVFASYIFDDYLQFIFATVGAMIIGAILFKGWIERREQ